MTNLNKSRTQSIASTILYYRENLLKDMNLKLRFVDEEGKAYLSALTQWEDDIITFTAPQEKGDLVIFPTPSYLECFFMTSHSMIVTQLELLERRRLGSDLLYRARILTPLEKKQNRAYFRLDTLVPLYYAVLTSPEGIKVEEPKKAKGKCVNISVGGMCMVCDDSLHTNQQLTIYLDFLDHYLELPGKVLHDGHKNENGTFSHRIQFEPLEIPKENLLSHLIFEKQRLQLQLPTNPLYKKNPSL